MPLSKGQAAGIAALGGLACLGIIVHFVLFILATVALITGIIDWTQAGEPDAWILVRVIGGGIYILYTLFRTRTTTNRGN